MFLLPWGEDWERLSEPPNGNLGVGRDMRCNLGPAVDVKLENTGNYDDGLRAIAILEHGELEGFSPTDKDPAAEPMLILDNPAAPAVLPNPEHGTSFGGLRRGRFTFVHGTSPSLVLEWATAVSRQAEDRRRSSTKDDSAP
jgi:hypothetical protein